jgi:hypothetical protein
LSIKLYFIVFLAANTYLHFFIGLLPKVKEAEKKEGNLQPTLPLVCSRF